MTFKPKIDQTSVSEMFRQNQNALQTQPKAEKKEAPKFDDPAKAAERIRIIFDDSGSMGGSKIEDAKAGCIEFLRNCKVNETACAIHLMNPELQDGLTDLTSLTTNLPALSILIQKISAPGSTPLFQTLSKAENSKPQATRFVVFSDGAPDSRDVDSYKEQTINKAIEFKTPVDTVLISTHAVNEDYREYQLLKELADRTGGYFLVFDRNKVNFKDAFKYLAPSLRGKLSDGKVRLALMAGELK